MVSAEVVVDQRRVERVRHLDPELRVLRGRAAVFGHRGVHRDVPVRNRGFGNHQHASHAPEAHPGAHSLVQRGDRRPSRRASVHFFRANFFSGRIPAGDGERERLVRVRAPDHGRRDHVPALVHRPQAVLDDHLVARFDEGVVSRFFFRVFFAVAIFIVGHAQVLDLHARGEGDEPGVPGEHHGLELGTGTRGNRAGNGETCFRESSPSGLGSGRRRRRRRTTRTREGAESEQHVSPFRGAASETCVAAACRSRCARAHRTSRVRRRRVHGGGRHPTRSRPDGDAKWRPRRNRG